LILHLKNLKKKLSIRQGIIALQNIYNNKFTGCCLAFNRSILNRVLMFPKEPIIHDSWIGLLACKYGKIKIEKQPYMLWRRHSSNASPIIGDKKNSLFFKVYYRFYIIKAF